MAKKKECGSFSAISILLLLMLRKGQNAFLFTLLGFIYYPVGLADYRDRQECLPFEIFRDEKVPKTETFYL